MFRKDFEKCRSLEQLKKLYFKLLKRYHPDVSTTDTTEECKQINNLYDMFFPQLKNIRENKEHKFYTKETTETSNIYREFLNEIIHLYGITIEICGTWIWISGETKPFRQTFRDLNCKWSNNKKMWYFTADTKTKYRKTAWDIDKIRETFGSINIDTEPAPQMN